MRVVIVGGGKVGGYLARELLETENVVTLIESHAEQAQRQAEAIGGLVLHGDGTDIDVLRDAKVRRADWLLAVTGQDEVNLVACQLGMTLGASRVLARLNDPRNRATFAALGIPVVAVTDLIGEVIERTLDPAQLERLTIAGGGAISLIEIEVGEETPPRAVAELPLPPETLVVAVVGPEGLVTVPGAATVIRSGDRVLAVTTLDREPEARDVLSGVAGNA